MRKQVDPLRLWEQDGDLELMKKFFNNLSGKDEKERIKQMVLAKLAQDGTRDTQIGQASRVERDPYKEHASLPARIKGAWQNSWRRWGWKMALPVAAMVLVAVIGQAGLGGLGDKQPASSPASQKATANLSVGNSPASENAAGSADSGTGRRSAHSSAATPPTGFGSQASSLGGGQTKDKAQVIVPPTPPAAPPADPSLPRKITRNMSATLQVEKVETAADKLNSLAQSLGGYTVDSQLDNQQDSSNAVAHVTFKIPADKFEGVRSSLAEIGKVLNQHISADDITNQYYDADTRLKNWQAEEQRYLDILRQAKSVNDILSVENSLSNIRMQIEQLKGQLKLWDNEVAYSTIQVQLQTKPNPVRVNEPWQPISWHTTWQAAKNAVLKTISASWNFLNYLVVGLGYALPFLVLAGAGYLGYRQWRRKKG